eukprot:5365344-Lingulodinium_polyedra.AAC.1
MTFCVTSRCAMCCLLFDVACAASCIATCAVWRVVVRDAQRIEHGVARCVCVRCALRVARCVVRRARR